MLSNANKLQIERRCEIAEKFRVEVHRAKIRLDKILCDKTAPASSYERALIVWEIAQGAYEAVRSDIC